MISRPSIDTLRGLACLLLVTFHVLGSSPSTGLHLPADSLAAELDDWLSVLRMPLFSFLSGLVYAHRPIRGDVGPFIQRKVRRLLVPMLLVGTAFAALQSISPGANAAPVDWRLLHIQPVAHYWFLEALFWIFLLVAMLERVRLLDSPWTFALAWLVAAIVQVDAPPPVWFGLEGAAYLLPYFLLGVAAFRFHAVLSRASVAGAAAVVLAASLAYLGSFPDLHLADDQSFPELAASVCCCLLLLHLRPRLAWLAWIGRWSFGIYLFHAVFAAAARVAMQHAGVRALPVLFTAGFIAGIAGPIVLTSVLRRVPGGHWLLGEKPKKEGVLPVVEPVARA